MRDRWPSHIAGRSAVRGVEIFVRTVDVPAPHGYAIVDGSVGVLLPDRWSPQLLVNRAEVRVLAGHFATLWQGDVAAIYEDLVLPCEPRAQMPLLQVQQRWDEVIRQLARSPGELFRLEPAGFEQLVGELLRREGIGDVTLTSQSHDGGRDLLVVTRSRLGQHLYLVECKRYGPDRPVGVGLVRSLYGVAEMERATAALLVTTSSFTKAAVSFREKVSHRLELTDYERLVAWLREASA